MTDQRRIVFKALTGLLLRNGVRHVVPHGREEIPGEAGGDVDMLIDPGVSDAKLREILSGATGIGARLIRQHGTMFVFLCDNFENGPHILALDVMRELAAEGRVLFSAQEALASARTVEGIEVPHPDVELAWLLGRAISRGKVSEPRRQLISQLIDQGAVTEARRIWRGLDLRQILPGGSCEEAGRELLKHHLELHPAAKAPGKLKRILRKCRNLLTPPGFHIVMLGPDGAGKSSVVNRLEARMEGAFARVQVLGFAPPLFKLWQRGPVNTSTPHARKARSYPVSLLRAGFWFVYNLLSRFTLRRMKAANTLIVNDRHFIDILVDPVRYRYGGPTWALKLVQFVMPKPDAIVLLAGPAEVLQARKNELSVEETAQQIEKYQALVSGRAKSHIVNADQPFDGVMRDVCGIIFNRR